MNTYQDLKKQNIDCYYHLLQSGINHLAQWFIQQQLIKARNCIKQWEDKSCSSWKRLSDTADRLHDTQGAISHTLEHYKQSDTQEEDLKNIKKWAQCIDEEVEAIYDILNEDQHRAEAAEWEEEKAFINASMGF